jgi:hypothetical protein
LKEDEEGTNEDVYECIEKSNLCSSFTNEASCTNSNNGVTGGCFIYLFIFLFFYLCLYLFIYLYFYLLIYIFIYLSLLFISFYYLFY